MAKIDRYDGNVAAFASNATGLNRTIFGDITQSDDLDDNINADFLSGWEIIGIADAPSKQDFNALGFTTTQLIAYVYQMGTPEWNDGQEYHSDSTCSYSGKLYISLTDGNVANTPSSSPSNWTPLATESDFGDYYTGTELDTGQLDSRYYTETELDAGQLDSRYYTETELDTGQLDNRYYTETELNAIHTTLQNNIDDKPDTDANETITGSWTFEAAQYINNNTYLYFKESGGTDRACILMNASNRLLLGSTNNQTTIRSNGTIAAIGSDMDFDNDHAVTFEDSGGTSRNAVGINSADDFVIGNTTCPTKIASDGTLEHNGATILEANSVSGSFTTVDGKTVTVVDGQITTIV